MCACVFLLAALTTQPTWWRISRVCTGLLARWAEASASSSPTMRSKTRPSWSTWTMSCLLERYTHTHAHTVKSARNWVSFFLVKIYFWGFCLYLERDRDSRLTGNGEWDGGWHAAKVVGIGSRTRYTLSGWHGSLGCLDRDATVQAQLSEFENHSYQETYVFSENCLGFRRHL